ncbi:MAG: hypothetical protein Q7T16_02640 [Candidatus Burarchaeum sp.]|nr:hypothetical protein [Candidatus Burarchaeum sp.]MDO8339531.1 hypothetical protein [Candidatus Burarchaeum sp.]
MNVTLGTPFKALLHKAVEVELQKMEGRRWLPMKEVMKKAGL